MRFRRGIMGGAFVAAATAAFVVIGAVVSSAGIVSSGFIAVAPSAPFNVIALNGLPGSELLGGTRVFEDMTVSASPDDRVQFEGGSNPTWIVLAQPPAGQSWQVGTTYTTNNGALPPTTEAAFLGVGPACVEFGSMTVLEVARTNSLVSSFAARFTISCGDTPALTGEVRWNSTIGYVAALGDAGLDFDQVNLWSVSPAKMVSFSSKGSQPITFGAASITGPDADMFRITENTCSGQSFAYGQSCHLSVVAEPLRIQQRHATLSIVDNTLSGAKFVDLRVFGLGPPPPPPPPAGWSNVGTFYPVVTFRILDTRSGTGAPRAKLGAQGELTLDVTGIYQLPSVGVSAVVLNVTVTNPTAPSFLTVYPDGVTRPTASSLNFVAGWTRANAVTVGVGPSGKVNIFNNAGSVDVIADVLGFYTFDDSLVPVLGTGLRYVPVVPQRLFDSRFELGKLTAGGRVQVGMSIDSVNVDPHIKAMVFNITATEPVGPGYLTTWAGSPWPAPNTSTVNYTKGQTVPNLAIAATSLCYACNPSGPPVPSIGVRTSVSSHVIVDLLGVFVDPELDGLRFSPMTPTRIVDTRIHLGIDNALTSGQTATVTVPGPVATDTTAGLAMNVTSAGSNANTFLTVWPAGIGGVGRPGSSNLNLTPGEVVPNAVYTLIGPTNAFNVYNNAGTTPLVIDVVGQFYFGADSPSALVARAGGPPAATFRQPSSTTYLQLEP